MRGREIGLGGKAGGAFRRAPTVLLSIAVVLMLSAGTVLAGEAGDPSATTRPAAGARIHWPPVAPVNYADDPNLPEAIRLCEEALEMLDTPSVVSPLSDFDDLQARDFLYRLDRLRRKQMKRARKRPRSSRDDVV